MTTISSGEHSKNINPTHYDDSWANIMMELHLAHTLTYIHRHEERPKTKRATQNGFLSSINLSVGCFRMHSQTILAIRKTIHTISHVSNIISHGMEHTFYTAILIERECALLYYMRMFSFYAVYLYSVLCLLSPQPSENR